MQVMTTTLAPEFMAFLNKYGLFWVCDLDEMLISVVSPLTPKRSLTNSASEELSGQDDSRISDGVVEDVRMWHDGTYAYEVTALSRQRWIEVFIKAVALNEKWQQLTGDPKALLVSCGVLTRANYIAEKVRKILSQFYGELFEKLFPEFEHRYYDSTLMERSGIRDLNKGKFLKQRWPQISTELCLSDPTQVVLIDDNQQNVGHAFENGFFGVHRPTNPRGKSKNVTYTKDGDRTFEMLMGFLEMLEAKLVEELMQKVVDPSTTESVTRAP